MAMIQGDYGGPLKKKAVDEDQLLSLASTADYNEHLTLPEHGGIIEPQDDWQGIDIVQGREIDNTKYIPPLPSNLIVDHGGPIKGKGTIVNDSNS